MNFEYTRYLGLRTLATCASFALLCAMESTPAHAYGDRCEALAAKTVRSKFSSYFYSHGKRIRTVESTDCEPKVSKKGIRYQFCEVGASTGDGAGDATFGVNLNESCTRAFAWYLIGRE